MGSVTELSPVNAVVMVVFANDADEQVSGLYLALQKVITELSSSLFTVD